MGSFIGHALPGSFFFLFGLWWVTQALRRHFRCRQTRQPFRASLTFPLPCCPVRRMRNFPVEAVVKIVLSCIGIFGELNSGLSHVQFFLTNAQHITMYFFFGLCGAVDLLVLRDLAPRGADYAALVQALLVEAGLFRFHLYGRGSLDVLLHTLLVYVIVLTVVLVGMEAAFRHVQLLPVLRGLLFMQQGSWFWAAGLILYNPLPGSQPWDSDPSHHHDSLMLAVVCFAGLLALNLLLVFFVGGVTFCCYRNKARYSRLTSLPLVDVGKDEEEEEEEDEEEEEVDLLNREPVRASLLKGDSVT